MNGRRSLLALALSLVVLASIATPVAADPSLSITDVSVPDSVTQGDDFDLTVSISGDELQNSEADVSLTLPDGLSCSPSGAQTATLSGGTGSASFDCSADVEGDYSGEITVSASGTNTNDGSDLSDSTQSGLEVISPASLTLSTTLDNSTVDEGSSTALTVVVQNSGDTSTSYQLSPSTASGYSTSVASGSDNGTISGGQTRTVEYTVTGDSSGDYTLNTTLTAGNGQNVLEGEALTVESTGGSTTGSTTGSTGGSSGGSGGDGDTPTPTETATPTATPTPSAEESPSTATTATPVSADDPTTDTPVTTASDTVTPTASSGPGFTVLAALLVTLGTVFLVRRRSLQG